MSHTQTGVQLDAEEDLAASRQLKVGDITDDGREIIRIVYMAKKEDLEALADRVTALEDQCTTDTNTKAIAALTEASRANNTNRDQSRHIENIYARICNLEEKTGHKIEYYSRKVCPTVTGDTAEPVSDAVKDYRNPYRWNKYPETKPDTDGRYICYGTLRSPSQHSPESAVRSWNGEYWGYGHSTDRITHWRPLPEPPKESV